ncbi:hypothetical protein E2C01_003419 [Portunus trituberculatus]|uniref:Uncharacterized protein n=1 Tax=Portunus trituberculatus TaxID=210409 RepID=A0A5B7CMS7_PORTR|nr:hypothetical protein [Portunus trituberculatus]
MRIEKVGGNREGATVSILRQLCFSEEKMRSLFYSICRPLREWVAVRHRSGASGSNGCTGGREGRRRHRSTSTSITTTTTTTTIAATGEHHNGTRHSHSPATSTDSNKKLQQGVDMRKQQRDTFANCVQGAC